MTRLLASTTTRAFLVVVGSILLLCLLPKPSEAFSAHGSFLSNKFRVKTRTTTLVMFSTTSTTAPPRPSESRIQSAKEDIDPAVSRHILPKMVATSLFAAMMMLTTTSSSVAHAYNSGDFASDTVQAVVQSLQQAGGNTEQTFKAYESIADIITEGRGVGGSINYQGVQLERGYVADEDTAIYNPGLTLLTESEKERLVEAIVQSRKAGLSSNNGWSENNQVAYDFLKEKLDPLHMLELKGYLGIVPFYGAVLYLGVLAVQQLSRDLFAPAYLVAAGLFFAPILALVALGPQ